MRSFLNAEEPRLARWLVRTWDNQQADITYAELRYAVLYGGVSIEQLERWQLSYSELVNTQLAPAWQKAMNEAAWNLKHQFPNSGWPVPIFYDPFMDATQDYIRKHGAELVTNIVNSQREAIRSLVSRATFYETAISPDALSRFIRPTIGLTRPQATANLNYWKAQWDAGAEMGLSVSAIEDRANRMAANYAARQHRYRAMMIARTELADAYNHGAYFGTLDAQEKGYLGDCKKIWVTAFDERVCPTCSALDGVSVNMDAMFPGGTLLPPKHPNCRCGVEFRQVSVPIMPVTEPLENVDINDIIEPEQVKRSEAVEYMLHDLEMPEDTIEDRRKFANNLIENLEVEGIKAELVTMDSRGECELYIENDTIEMISYKLEKDDNRSIEYKVKTAFHEGYHLLSHGRKTDLDHINLKDFLMLEETFAETSAHYSAKALGINKKLYPAYPETLIETLPRLKQLPEYNQCTTLSDFGKIALQERLDGGDAMWGDLHNKLFSQKFDDNKYQIQYLSYIKSNKSSLIDMVLENAPTESKSIYETILDRAISKIDGGLDSIGSNVINDLTFDEKNIFTNLVVAAMSEKGVI